MPYRLQCVSTSQKGQFQGTKRAKRLLLQQVPGQLLSVVSKILISITSEIIQDYWLLPYHPSHQLQLFPLQFLFSLLAWPTVPQPPVAQSTFSARALTVGENNKKLQIPLGRSQEYPAQAWEQDKTKLGVASP